MTSNNVSRQALGREYYKLLDRMCDCHAMLTAIVMNASYNQAVKDTTDPRVRDIHELIETMFRGLEEVIDRQMRTKTTIEA